MLNTVERLTDWAMNEGEVVQSASAILLPLSLPIWGSGPIEGRLNCGPAGMCARLDESASPRTTVSWPML